MRVIDAYHTGRRLQKARRRAAVVMTDLMTEYDRRMLRSIMH